MSAHKPKIDQAFARFLEEIKEYVKEEISRQLESRKTEETSGLSPEAATRLDVNDPQAKEVIKQTADDLGMTSQELKEEVLDVQEVNKLMRAHNLLSKVAARKISTR